ncbi:MAG: polymorphic toxin-type HINT domain-containing protein [Pirellulales bacterium]|nr:polymorphic toxin-type HINT domain-containing protein [Pirellulales bacterium]
MNGQWITKSNTDPTPLDPSTLAGLVILGSEDSETIDLSGLAGSHAQAWNISVDGRGGDDNIVGSPGNDSIAGGHGNDIISVSTNDRILFESFAFGNDTVNMAVQLTAKSTLDFVNTSGLGAVKITRGNFSFVVTSEGSHTLELESNGGEFLVTKNGSGSLFIDDWAHTPANTTWRNLEGYSYFACSTSPDSETEDKLSIFVAGRGNPADPGRPFVSKVILGGSDYLDNLTINKFGIVEMAFRGNEVLALNTIDLEIDSQHSTPEETVYNGFLNTRNNNLIVRAASSQAGQTVFNKVFDMLSFGGMFIEAPGLINPALTAGALFLNEFFDSSPGAPIITFEDNLNFRPLFPGISELRAEDVIMVYTYSGDGNFDFRVDGADYSPIDSAFGSVLPPHYARLLGDYDRSAQVNGGDYSAVDGYLGSQPPDRIVSATGPGGLAPGDAIPLEISENTPSLTLNLRDYFTHPSQILRYVLEIDHLEHFGVVSISPDVNRITDRLVLNGDFSGFQNFLQANTYAQATLRVRAYNDVGLSADAYFKVSLNGSPPVSFELPKLIAATGDSASQVSLYHYFDDRRDSDTELLFAITGNSNSAIFSSAPQIDPATGVLTITPSATMPGTAVLTIRVTDSQGMYVTRALTFTVAATVAPQLLRADNLTFPSQLANGSAVQLDIRGEVITQQAQKGWQTIEIDTNNDGKPEIQTFADSTGKFRIQDSQYQTVANIPLKLRIREKVGLTYQFSAWQTVSGAPNSQPADGARRIESLNVTGAGGTFPFISQPTLNGKVTGLAAGQSVDLIVDTNQDGLADATFAAYGEFTYAPADLPLGRIVIGIRPRDQESALWSTVTFIHTESPGVATGGHSVQDQLDELRRQYNTQAKAATTGAQFSLTEIASNLQSLITTADATLRTATGAYQTALTNYINNVLVPAYNGLMSSSNTHLSTVLATQSLIPLGLPEPWKIPQIPELPTPPAPIVTDLKFGPDQGYGPDFSLPELSLLGIDSFRDLNHTELENEIANANSHYGANGDGGYSVNSFLQPYYQQYLTDMQDLVADRERDRNAVQNANNLIQNDIPAGDRAPFEQAVLVPDIESDDSLQARVQARFEELKVIFEGNPLLFISGRIKIYLEKYALGSLTPDYNITTHRNDWFALNKDITETFNQFDGWLAGQYAAHAIAMINRQADITHNGLNHDFLVGRDGFPGLLGYFQSKFRDLQYATIEETYERESAEVTKAWHLRQAEAKYLNAKEIINARYREVVDVASEVIERATNWRNSIQQAPVTRQADKVIHEQNLLVDEATALNVRELEVLESNYEFEKKQIANNHAANLEKIRNHAEGMRDEINLTYSQQRERLLTELGESVDANREAAEFQVKQIELRKTLVQNLSNLEAKSYNGGAFTSLAPMAGIDNPRIVTANFSEGKLKQLGRENGVVNGSVFEPRIPYYFAPTDTLIDFKLNGNQQFGGIQFALNHPVMSIPLLGNTRITGHDFVESSGYKIIHFDDHVNYLRARNELEEVYFTSHNALLAEQDLALTDRKLSLERELAALNQSHKIALAKVRFEGGNPTSLEFARAEKQNQIDAAARDKRIRIAEHAYVKESAAAKQTFSQNEQGSLTTFVSSVWNAYLTKVDAWAANNNYPPAWENYVKHVYAAEKQLDSHERLLDASLAYEEARLTSEFLAGMTATITANAEQIRSIQVNSAQAEFGLQESFHNTFHTINSGTGGGNSSPLADIEHELYLYSIDTLDDTGAYYTDFIAAKKNFQSSLDKLYEDRDRDIEVNQHDSYYHVDWTTPAGLLFLNQVRDIQANYQTTGNGLRQNFAASSGLLWKQHQEYLSQRGKDYAVTTADKNIQIAKAMANLEIAGLFAGALDLGVNVPQGRLELITATHAERERNLADLLKNHTTGLAQAQYTHSLGIANASKISANALAEKIRDYSETIAELEYTYSTATIHEYPAQVRAWANAATDAETSRLRHLVADLADAAATQTVAIQSAALDYANATIAADFQQDLRGANNDYLLAEASAKANREEVFANAQADKIRASALADANRQRVLKQNAAELTAQINVQIENANLTKDYLTADDTFRKNQISADVAWLALAAEWESLESPLAEFEYEDRRTKEVTGSALGPASTTVTADLRTKAIFQYMVGTALSVTAASNFVTAPTTTSLATPGLLQGFLDHVSAYGAALTEHVDALTEIDKSRIKDASKAGEGYLEANKAANQTWLQSVKTAAQTAANTLGNAQKAYLIASAADELTYLDELHTAENNYVDSMIARQAETSFEEDVAAAEWAFITSIVTSEVTAANSALAANPTNLNLIFQSKYAQAKLAWINGLADEYAEYKLDVLADSRTTEQGIRSANQQMESQIAQLRVDSAQNTLGELAKKLEVDSARSKFEYAEMQLLAAEELAMKMHKLQESTSLEYASALSGPRASYAELIQTRSDNYAQLAAGISAARATNARIHHLKVAAIPPQAPDRLEREIQIAAARVAADASLPSDPSYLGYHYKITHDTRLAQKNLSLANHTIAEKASLEQGKIEDENILSLASGERDLKQRLAAQELATGLSSSTEETRVEKLILDKRRTVSNGFAEQERARANQAAADYYDFLDSAAAEQLLRLQSLDNDPQLASPSAQLVTNLLVTRSSSGLAWVRGSAKTQTLQTHADIAAAWKSLSVWQADQDHAIGVETLDKEQEFRAESLRKQEELVKRSVELEFTYVSALRGGGQSPAATPSAGDPGTGGGATQKYRAAVASAEKNAANDQALLEYLYFPFTFAPDDYYYHLQNHDDRRGAALTDARAAFLQAEGRARFDLLQGQVNLEYDLASGLLQKHRDQQQAFLKGTNPQPNTPGGEWQARLEQNQQYYATLATIFAEERDLAIDLATGWRNLTASLPANPALAGNPYAQHQANLGQAEYQRIVGVPAQNGQPAQAGLAQAEYDSDLGQAAATRDHNITLINADIEQKSRLVTETSAAARGQLELKLSQGLAAAGVVLTAALEGKSEIPLPGVAWAPVAVQITALGVAPLALETLTPPGPPTPEGGPSAEIAALAKAAGQHPQGEANHNHWGFVHDRTRPQIANDPWGVAGKWYDLAYENQRTLLSFILVPGAAQHYFTNKAAIPYLSQAARFTYYSLFDRSQGDAFTRITNLGAAFGDTISFGITAGIRHLGGFDAVDYKSGAYQIGGYAGQVFNIATLLVNPQGLINAGYKVTQWGQVGLKIINGIQTVGGVTQGVSAATATGDYSQLLLAGGMGLARFSKCTTGWREVLRQGVINSGSAVGAYGGLQQMSNGDIVGGLLTIGESAASSWRASKACFAAGTPLLTNLGGRFIEQIREDDFVATRNESDPHGPVVYKRVEEVFEGRECIWELRVAGKTVRTTAEHPFWVVGGGVGSGLPDKGWTNARDLQPGDKLGSHNGVTQSVESVKNTGEWATVYNLRVADYHTYFVGELDWGWSVWAHNACVYESRDRITGQVLYVGIADSGSTRTFPQRARTALNRTGIAGEKIFGADNLTPRQAYAIEQALIQHHGRTVNGTGTLDNIYRGTRLSTRMLAYGNELLKLISYPGF